MVIRLQIPESPRYTMDVLLNGKKALQDTRGYFFVPEDTPMVQDADDDNPENGLSRTEAFASGPQHANGGMGQGYFRDSRAETGSRHQSVSPSVQRPQISRMSNQMHYPFHTRHPSPSARFVGGDQQIEKPPFTFSEWWSGFNQYVFTERNWIHLAGTMISWFLLDVRSTNFLLTRLRLYLQLLTGIQVSFYGLGMSSPKVIQKLWDGLYTDTSATRTVYQLLSENSWHSSIVVSLGALFGGVVMIYVVQHSRLVKVQSLFFMVLGVFLFVTGGTFKPFLVPEPGSGSAGDHWALVIFYFLCNFFFNLGANATTFIVSFSLEGFLVRMGLANDSADTR